MALPACFYLADDVFPRVRAEAARRLVAQGWSQTKIAAALHVSQAMVSKYAAKHQKEDDGLILHMVEDFMESVDSPISTGGPSAWCDLLSPTDARHGSQQALDDLLAAERSLVADPPLALVPQIGLNIARAVPDAKDYHDILAYPGRLVAAGDRLASPAPPAWGASRHLAACLLALRQHAPEQMAVANIRGTPEVIASAKAAGLGPVTVDRSGSTEDAPIMKRFQQGHSIVHDAGAVGIEPCLYITGDSAVSVAATIRSIHQGLTQ